MTLHRLNLGLAVVGVLLASACGTTVPLAQQAGSATVRDGLSNEVNGDGGATTPTAEGTTATTPGNPGGALPGSRTTTTSGPVVSAPTTTRPTTANQTTAPLPSGPKVTAPIQIGYLGAASSAGVNAALGAGAPPQESPQEAFDFLVSALNKQGGLAGRQIEAMTSFIDPLSSNYDTQGSAACANFTQDHHVAAVLAQEDFYYSENFSSCMKKAGVPEVQAITGGVDAQTLTAYPMLFSVSAPTVERRFTAMIKGLTDKGFLTRASKIGIVVEDCPYNLRAYDKAIGPAFKARGLNVTKRTISCVHGFGDAASAISAFQNQVLPFAAAGIDRVMFQSGFESIGLSYFEQQAKQQSYRPLYALTSTANAGENSVKLSTEALQRVQGVGWEPDLDSLSLLPNGAATQRCRTLWKGFAPAAQRQNRRSNEMLCELFFFYEAGLKATNGLSDPKAIVPALHQLGTTYLSPLSLTGASRYGPSRKDGPALFATFGYLPKCACIGYTGAPTPFA